MTQILCWLRTYEYVAVWLEGIALVAIFVWDRFDANSQHREAVEQLRTSQELVEAAYKPCLVFCATPREPVDAVLAQDLPGYGGSKVIRCPEGLAQIENIGNGPALNTYFKLTPTNPQATILRPNGYFGTVLSGEQSPLPVARGALQNVEWECVFTYESLGGRKYETKIIANDLVLTSVRFSNEIRFLNGLKVVAL
jgi:hypothetical protein